MAVIVLGSGLARRVYPEIAATDLADKARGLTWDDDLGRVGRVSDPRGGSSIAVSARIELRSLTQPCQPHGVSAALWIFRHVREHLKSVPR
jgi:hypothetical protein